jgi:hypothetical protein
MNERTIPDAALRDENAVEMLRVWIAERGLHCSLKVGMYEESSAVKETDAWGTILADATRHIADALAKAYAADRKDVVEEIRQRYLAELANPTSPVSGRFV